MDSLEMQQILWDFIEENDTDSIFEDANIEPLKDYYCTMDDGLRITLENGTDVLIHIQVQ